MTEVVPLALATAPNPCRSNISHVPVNRNASACGRPCVAVGTASTTRAPLLSIAPIACFSKSSDSPRRLQPRWMKKHPTNQTPSPGLPLNLGERASRGRDARGSNEHHPTASSPSYARTPCAYPSFTCRQRRECATSPWTSFQCSTPAMRHHWHQQPPHAPFLPNSASSCGQSPGSSSRQTIPPSAPDVFKCHPMYSMNVLCGARTLLDCRPVRLYSTVPRCCTRFPA